MIQRPIRTETTSALVVAGAATAVMLLLGFLARRVAADPVSTPLIEADGRLYYVVAIACAAGIAVAAITRGVVPRDVARARDWRAGVVPGFAALAGALALVFHHSIPSILLIPVGVGVTSFFWLALSHLALSRLQRRVARDVLAVGTLYVLLALAIGFRTRALYGGSVAGIAAAITVLVALGVDVNRPRVIRAAAIGLIAGELVWAINYLNMSHWVSAIPVVAIVAIGGWQVRRDERGSLPASEVPAGEPGSSKV